MEFLTAVSLFDVATGVIIAMLIIDRFTNFLGKIKGAINGGDSHTDKLADRMRRNKDLARQVWHTEEGADALSKIRTLYIWHNKTDEDGVPIWYVRRGLERSVQQLAKNIDKQTRVLERLLREDMPE